MSPSARPVWAEVNLANIAHNVKQFRRMLPENCHLMAVVKANGYGHGDLEVARTALAHGATWLGVALPEEGARLRRAGIASRILVLGAVSLDQLELCVTKDLAVTVFQWDVAQALSALACRMQKTVRIHVKVDTGMGRLGLLPNEVISFVKRAKSLPGLEIQGLFSHFASADSAEREYTEWQWQRFSSLQENLEKMGLNIPIKHFANTAATLFHPYTHLDMVRVGIGLYGLFPSNERPIPLRPALSLKTRIAAIKRVPPGSGISYSRTYVTWKETSIVVLPLGYGDGVSRRLSNRGMVLIGGRRFPMVGNICMDHCMVDIGDFPAAVGDEVVLIGSQGEERITADDWARWLGTINYEVVCMLGERIPRVYC